ncbi:YcgL domain-containing protein [Salinibius halmophilus]|uniref:YcgL domain-containing protein n=1 Tax=Salinibius halmophilus TaxID=1853216 RepID=UPI000E6600AD|nr:YcgL domain-containing protein [Salinibius halmophilus]
MNRKFVRVYKTAKREQLYLYVDRQEDLKRVPEALLEQFGKPVVAMEILVDDSKELAKLSGKQLLEHIEQQGFYLQMPPQKEDYMLDLYKAERRDAF